MTDKTCNQFAAFYIAAGCNPVPVAAAATREEAAFQAMTNMIAIGVNGGPIVVGSADMLTPEQFADLRVAIEETAADFAERYAAGEWPEIVPEGFVLQ